MKCFVCDQAVTVLEIVQKAERDGLDNFCEPCTDELLRVWSKVTGVSEAYLRGETEEMT